MAISRLLNASEWLDAREASTLLAQLLGINFVPIARIYALFCDGLISAYVYFVQPCPMKPCRASAHGGYELVPGAPMRPAHRRWRLLRHGQGLHEIELRVLEPATRSISPYAHPDGLLVEGLEHEQGQLGRLYFELRPRLVRSALPHFFARHTGYANPQQPSSFEEDYVLTPRLPHGILVQFSRAEIVTVVKQRQWDRPAPARQLAMRDDLRSRQALNIILFALVAKGRTCDSLSADLAPLATRIYGELPRAAIRTTQQQLHTCLFFAAGQLRPGLFRGAQLELGKVTMPSLAILYSVVLDLAVGLQGYDPSAQRNDCTAVIARHISRLGLPQTRRQDCVRRQLVRAVQMRWPSELDPVAMRPLPQDEASSAAARNGLACAE